jgi:hypothetical protein
VEEGLNALLDAEVDHLCGARIETRKDKRAGSYDCQLHTKAGGSSPDSTEAYRTVSGEGSVFTRTVYIRNNDKLALLCSR